MQPGPLSKPPSERSSETPSFRIIDFGRAQFYDALDKQDWKNGLQNEVRQMKPTIDGDIRKFMTHFAKYRDGIPERESYVVAREYSSDRPFHFYHICSV